MIEVGKQSPACVCAYAQIVKRGDDNQYFIHYQGWKKKWDWCVGVRCVYVCALMVVSYRARVVPASCVCVCACVGVCACTCSWVHASLLIKEGKEAEECAKRLKDEEKQRKAAEANAKKRCAEPKPEPQHHTTPHHTTRTRTCTRTRTAALITGLVWQRENRGNGGANGGEESACHGDNA